jgi:arylsulfatase A-like enzyme
MKRMVFALSLWLGVAGLALLGFVTGALGAPAKPNIVLILADDLGYADVGFHGCQDIPTPHLDRLATEGVRCTDGYVSYCVCSPSRAGILTGRYQSRFGHETNPAYAPEDRTVGLPLSEWTLADVLKPAGYATGLVGKWHQGDHPDLHPNRRGFDFFFGFTTGGHAYFPEQYAAERQKQKKHEYISPLERDGVPILPDPQGYLTDILTQEAIGFVERHARQPFFLFLSYNAPHTPLQVPEETLARFASVEDPKRRAYAAMVYRMDENIGRFLAALQRHHLDERTLIFFLSDNGGPSYANASNNQPLKGGKSSLLEGGCRVPFVVRWTGVLPAGTVYSQPVISHDNAATAVALAEARPAPERPLDGVNLIPFLTGRDAGRPHAALFWRKFFQGHRAARVGDWKMVQADGAPQLFDLSRDVGEQQDLAATHPEKLAELVRAWEGWNARMATQAAFEENPRWANKRLQAPRKPGRAASVEED